jgi:hypothetical protein
MQPGATTLLVPSWYFPNMVLLRPIILSMPPSNFAVLDEVGRGWFGTNCFLLTTIRHPPTIVCHSSLLSDCRGVGTRVKMAAVRARFGCMHTGGAKGDVGVLGHAKEAYTW